MSIIARGLLAILALSMLPVVDSGAVHGQSAVQPVRRHALLIGIRKYAIRPLDGPPNDVRSLAALLRERYKFDSVQTLEDEFATRNGILSAIDALQTRTSPGDFVLVYYSGHGTSALDRRLRLPGLSTQTGALLPADFSLASTDAELLAKVIIGARDLRPRFERLEATRDVVVIFDTCFSANTARSLGVDDGNTSRSVPWDRIVDKGLKPNAPINFGGDDKPGEFGAETTANAYPYKRTIYFAAAGAGEEAQDIAEYRLRRYPTVDGMAHGAFTNALLKGLAGDANTNGDDIVTYRELFEFARTEVTRLFPHTPQLSAPIDAETMLDKGVFGTRGVVRPPAPPAPIGPLRVLVKPGTAPEIRNALTGIPGTSLVSAGAHDVRIENPPGYAVVHHGSGDRLIEFQGVPSYLAEQVATRIRRQARLHPLLNMAFPSQTFNVSVNLPAPRGYLVTGEKSFLRFDSEMHAFLLILNIDVEGKIAVLYPRSGEELRHTTAGLNVELFVDPRYPTGTEFVKVFAFEQRPPGVERFSGQEFDGDSPLVDSMISMIHAAPGRRAQALLKVVTATKVD